MTFALFAAGQNFVGGGALFDAPTPSAVSHLTCPPFSTGAESAYVTASLWFKRENSAARETFYPIFMAGFNIIFQDPDLIAVNFSVNSQGAIIQWKPLPPDGKWHHYLMCLDSSSGQAFLAIDGTLRQQIYSSVPVTGNTTFSNNPDLPIEVNPTQVKCSLAELYFTVGHYLDASDPAQVAKFLRGGKPVGIGSNGSVPTGEAPDIYLSGAGAAFRHNRGTKGDMSLLGVELQASSLVTLS